MPVVTFSCAKLKHFFLELQLRDLMNNFDLSVPEKFSALNFIRQKLSIYNDTN